jgi:hypothetical protein
MTLFRFRRLYKAATRTGVSQYFARSQRKKTLRLLPQDASTEVRGPDSKCIEPALKSEDCSFATEWTSPVFDIESFDS